MSASVIASAQGGQAGLEDWSQAGSKVTPFTLTADKWVEYVKYRPNYPDSLFKRWLAYHKGPLVTAHEIGTGCGIGTARFLDVAVAEGKLINHMILSDPAASNVATTKQNLGGSGQYPATHFTVQQAKGEDAFLAPNSVDFAFACEALHWCDIGPTMDNIHDSLRPGGTFAAVFYRMLDRGACSNKKVDGAISAFLAKLRASAAESFGGEIPEAARRATEQMDALNFIPFPAEKWEQGARRIFVNVPEGQLRWFRDTYGFTEEIRNASVSRVDEDREKLEWVRDDAWTRTGCTIEWLKGAMESSVLVRADSPPWEMAEWKAVEAAMEAAGGQTDVTAQVSVVLALKMT